MEKLVHKTMPGYCVESIDKPQPAMARKFVEFVLSGTSWPDLWDIGEDNYKAYALRKAKYNVIQVRQADFNYPELIRPMVAGPVNVTCFEIIEHLQNPLQFLKEVMRIVGDDKLFLSTPNRPRFLWTTHHFIEYSPKHLQKWLLNPLGLEIVRMKRVRIDNPWWFYLTGIRPFLRLFWNYTVIYEIRKTKT